MRRPYTTHADSYALYANELALKEKRIELLEASLRECVTWIDRLCTREQQHVPDCVDDADALLDGKHP